MKAIVFQNGILGLNEIQMPCLEKGWARLRLLSAGLCGTDIAKYSTCSLPEYHTNVLGHEFVGVVEKIYASDSKVALGDSVVAMPLLPCNDCLNCRQGHHNLCAAGKAIGRTESGAFAGYVDVPVSNLVKVLKDDSEVYILLDPLAVCVHAANFVLRDIVPKKCLVIGDGTIACLQAWLQLQYGDEVWMMGKHQTHLDFMSQFGIRQLQAQNDDMESFDVVFEAVGRAQEQTLKVAIEMIAPRGQIIILGVYEPGFLLPIEVRKIFIKEASIVGTNAYTPSEFMDAYELVHKNIAELKKFITHWIPVSQLESALHIAQHKEGLVLKIGLTNDLSKN